VVVRDDSGGTGPKPFTDLVDPGDSKAGLRVVRDAKFNFSGFLGQQRTGGDVAITVDPTNKNTVYIAYNDDQPGGIYGLHVFKSVDAGKTWTADFRPMLRDALNPGLAVNSAGKLGLLYQQLTGMGAARTWSTKFEILKANGTPETVFELHRAPDNRPAKQFDPYLGDYAHLMSVGKDFYGIFSGSNSPRKDNFPSGIVYQRNANWVTGKLLDVDNIGLVNPSIDPFFFKVKG
jgi:hypothetical protein